MTVYQVLKIKAEAWSLWTSTLIRSHRFDCTLTALDVTYWQFFKSGPCNSGQKETAFVSDRIDVYFKTNSPVRCIPT